MEKIRKSLKEIKNFIKNIIKDESESENSVSIVLCHSDCSHCAEGNQSISMPCSSVDDNSIHENSKRPKLEELVKDLNKTVEVAEEAKEMEDFFKEVQT